MSAAAAPFGLRYVYHPSGEPRIETLTPGIASGQASAIYTGTPVSIDPATGMLQPVGSALPCIGIFTGCFFISGNRPFLLPYWPAGQTYDAGTTMNAWYTPFDSQAILEGQADGPVAQTKNGEAINIGAVSGSIYTGKSSQALVATTTGATVGTFIVQNVAPYADNAWGDAFTIVRVRIFPAPPIA
jgi:hypothetical protein